MFLFALIANYKHFECFLPYYSEEQKPREYILTNIFSFFHEEFCFFLSQTELWFSRELHCKGHTAFSLSKQESNLKYKQTHKNLSRGKEYCKELTEEKVLQRQNATVACFLHRWRSWLWGSSSWAWLVIAAEDPLDMNFRSIHHTLCYRDFIILRLIFLVRFWTWYPKWSSTLKSMDEKC